VDNQHQQLQQLLKHSMQHQLQRLHQQHKVAVTLVVTVQ
jgi:hypothetical protein